MEEGAALVIRGPRVHALMWQQPTRASPSLSTVLTPFRVSPSLTGSGALIDDNQSSGEI